MESAPWLVDMVANSADGMFGVDDQDRIIVWNRAAEQILGYRAEDVIGRPCYEVVQGRDDDGSMLCHEECDVLSCVRRGGLPHHYAALTPTRDGGNRWLDFSILVLSGHGASPWMALHVFRDVTDERQIQNFGTEILLKAADFKVQRERGGPELPPEQVPQLTPREREVLRLLAAGSGSQEVARALTISVATARNHIQNIISKLGVHSSLQAVAYAYRHGLL